MVYLFEDAEELVENVKVMLSSQYEQRLRPLIVVSEMTSLKLLTKYHKTMKKRVYFFSPTPDADAFHNVGNNS